MRLLTATAFAFFALILSAGTASAADPLKSICGTPKAPSQAGASPTCQQYFEQVGDTTNANPVVDTIRTAANLIAVVAVVGAVIIIIISGFKYVTAGGGDSPAKSKEARSTLIGAVIGLIIVALAWAIVNFVTSRLIHA
jgi:hypothetical protein